MSALSRVKTWGNETLFAADLNAEFDNIINFLNAGTFTISGVLDISDASAGQIKFPATQNPTANANTLDDYKEATWTPTFQNLTVVGAASHSASYIKVGRIIIFKIRMAGATSVATTTSTYCDNFPFTISSTYMPVAMCSEDQTKTAIGLGAGNTNTILMGAIAATSAIAMTGVVIATA